MTRDLSRAGGIGLACAGGVLEGAFYEVGVLCALEETVEGLDLTSLQAYAGVSAGAVLVAALANGIPPREMAHAIVGGLGPELDLQPERLFSADLKRQAMRLARLPVALGGSILEYLRSPARTSVLSALSGIMEALPLSLFDNAPLERYLAGVFSLGGRTNDFRELRTMLRIMAVNLDTAELVVFGDAATEHIPISKAVQASAALPILFSPVEVEGEYYIDGVARRTMHASQPLSAGVDLLFCINPIVPIDLHARGQGPPLKRSLVDYGLPALLSQTFRTIIHSRLRAGFRDYAHTFPDADLILIEPDPSDHSMFFTNILSFSNRRDVCEHGYQSARLFLRREAERLGPILARHGLRLRSGVLRDPTRVLFPEDRPETPPRATAHRSRPTTADLPD